MTGSFSEYVYAYDTTEAYAEPKKKKRKAYLTHVVGTGETIYSILVRYGLPLSVLREDNPELADIGRLRVGAILQINKSRIGSADKSQIAAEIEADRLLNHRDEEVRHDTDIYADDKSEIIVDSEGFVHHTVRKGETLFSISRYYGVAVPVLREQNMEKLYEGLRAGDELLVPIDKSYIEKGEFHGRPIRLMGDDNDPDVYEGTRPVRHYGTASMPINVALMLPMTSEGRAQTQFSEFYQGVLVALDTMKREGASINMRLYDTMHDSTKVSSIISSGEIADVDLIIGPVYGDTFEQVARYAHKRQIPIVSPLVSVDCNDNPFVYQMVSDESSHYDKLSTLFYGKRVVIMETGDEDKDFIDFVMRHADDCTIETFDREVKPDEAAMAIPDNKATVYVVGTKSRDMTIQVISKLAGIKTMAGGLKDISVVASSRIARMGIDPATLFKLGVSYVTTYHVDRSNLLVRKFDANYIGLFGKVPSLYAYKGYDLAMFFFGSMLETGSNFGDYMDNYYTTILQSRYKLKKVNPEGKFINTEWVLVTYTPEYNIVVQ